MAGKARKKKLKLLPTHLLRLAFLLILSGLFLPLGCQSNAIEISNGILGRAKLGSKTLFLAPIDDLYAYILLAVFILVLIALIVTLFNASFLTAWIFIPLSLGLAVILLLKFNVYFDYTKIAFYMRAGPIRKKIIFDPGFYVMLGGYLLSIISLLFQLVKKNT